MKNKIIIALPKGRISDELIPILKEAKINAEKEFFNEDSRKLLPTRRIF